MSESDNHLPKGSSPDSVRYPNLLPEAEGKGIPERGHRMCKGRRWGRIHYAPQMERRLE